MGAQYISLEITKEFTPNLPPERNEMPTKLTAVSIEKIPLPATGRIDVYDDQVPGLVLRVSSTGTKSWSFTYRVYHKPKRLSLGGYPGVSLKLARERAREARGSIQRGEDPVATKKAEELDRQRNGFAACARDFVVKYCKPKLRTWSEVESAFERLAIPKWGDRPVKEIRRRDVVELLEVVAEKTPYQANHLRAYLSRFFRWCIEREIIPEINPVTGVTRSIKPVARSRILSDAEIVALWSATEKLGGAFAACGRVLLLTGMRRDEAGLLRWGELDGSFACLPATRIKSNRDMKVALSSTAKAIIEGMPRFDKCDYVFSTNGKSPISGWSKAKDKITELMTTELGGEVPIWIIRRQDESDAISVPFGGGFAVNFDIVPPRAGRHLTLHEDVIAATRSAALRVAIKLIYDFGVPGQLFLSAGLIRFVVNVDDGTRLQHSLLVLRKSGAEAASLILFPPETLRFVRVAPPASPPPFE